MRTSFRPYRELGEDKMVQFFIDKDDSAEIRKKSSLLPYDI